MAKGKKAVGESKTVVHYQHSEDKRINIPTATTAGQGALPQAEKKRYYYNPHLPPVLRFDPTGKADRIQTLLDKARTEPITAEEHQILAEALRNHQPWLEWTGKREAEEKGYFEVDPVALNIHERISTQAILRSARREDAQRDLFADPQEPWKDAVKFYQHDIDWTNRLILGDSLQVMSSLAHRESLAGKVQMIYMDPPYGINFKSNFQPSIKSKEVKDTEEYLARELETVKAYRDTWALGTHSYLEYLANRLLAARNLLSDRGSLFVQIGDENEHSVRALLDGVFGPENYIGFIAFKKKKMPLRETYIFTMCDYLLWYAKDRTQVKFHKVYIDRPDPEDSMYQMVQMDSGDVVPITNFAAGSAPIGNAFGSMDLRSSGRTESCVFDYPYQGKKFFPSGNRSWKTNLSGMRRLDQANRLLCLADTLRYRLYLRDYPVQELSHMWMDTQGQADKQFTVQTPTKIVERCLLMTTDPGDLVLDPTCGSGTTAYVAEQWGRRWITVDTSRVALSIARQRFLTARFEHFATKVQSGSIAENPGTGFIYKAVPHITLKSIAQNINLDPIFEKHQPILDGRLENCNAALKKVSDSLRKALSTKLLVKQKEQGKKAITDADERRWNLPKKWEHWEVPFDTDPEWTADLRKGVEEYRAAWRAKMDEVNACIAANADQEELVDKPKMAPGVRVSGPFTVEGVMPAETDLSQPDEPEADGAIDSKNTEAYLEQMVRLLKLDGVTFKGNKIQRFAQIEPLWKNGQDLPWHAEGWWEGDDVHQKAKVGIFFGPQYGPVTPLALEEVFPKAGRTYDELVVAGFSFDPEATQMIGDASNHPRIKVHQAFIRPDVNPGMEGLLKEQPRSQLFTVFGQPDISITKNKTGDYQVKLGGVDVYDPLTGSINSTTANKVAAWFLDSDYDGRCFCMTQAFFPDQDAWEKIAKALKSDADQYAFESLAGTESIPFKPGEHKRVAVKVIDPRGNEVMVVRRLEE